MYGAIEVPAAVCFLLTYAVVAEWGTFSLWTGPVSLDGLPYLIPPKIPAKDPYCACNLERYRLVRDFIVGGKCLIPSINTFARHPRSSS